MVKNTLNRIPELYSYITARRENFGGFLFNPYLFDEIALSKIEMRITELCNGNLSIKEIIKIVSKEFVLFTIKGENTVINVLNKLAGYYAIKWRKQRKKDASEYKQNLLINNTNELTRVTFYEEDYYHAPISIIWDLTYKCNLSCKHCLVDAGRQLKDELSLEEIKGIIDQISEMKIFGITFSGGEPLLRRDFFEILRYASKQNIGVKFSTNGVLVTAQVLKELESSSVFVVQISIDGMKKTHDSFRGASGTFEKATEAIRKFVDAGYWTIVSTMMTKYNLHEIKPVLELAISLGAATFKLSSFIPIGRGEQHIEELLLSQLETRNLAKEMLELKKRYEDDIQMEIEGTFPWLMETPPADVKTKMGRKIRLGCSAGRSQLVISPDGMVLPCPFLRDFIAGDLRKENLKDIWEKREVFGIFRNIEKESLKGKCRTCEYSPSYCQGGCRAASYILNKDFYAEDPFCWYKVQ